MVGIRILDHLRRGAALRSISFSFFFTQWTDPKVRLAVQLIIYYTASFCCHNHLLWVRVCRLLFFVGVFVVESHRAVNPGVLAPVALIAHHSIFLILYYFIEI